MNCGIYHLIEALLLILPYLHDMRLFVLLLVLLKEVFQL